MSDSRQLSDVGGRLRYQLSAEIFERLHGLRRRSYLSADYNEGVRAFLEKRRPCFGYLPSCRCTRNSAEN
jgi:hypothetical protein